MNDLEQVIEQAFEQRANRIAAAVNLAIGVPAIVKAHIGQLPDHALEHVRMAFDKPRQHDIVVEALIE